jgi:RNA polymerase sigma-70 factor (ECF subfamily)
MHENAAIAQVAPARVDFLPLAGLRPSERGSQAGDAALVRAVGQGDRRASVEIWRKYRTLVRSRMGRSIGEQDIEDHVQDVFVGLFENLCSLRNPDALRAFILGIAVRVAGSELRRRHYRRWLLLSETGELPEPRWLGDDGTDAREILHRLVGIIERLGPDAACIFEMRYVEDRDVAEVAEVLGVSLATMKRRLARTSSRFLAMARRDPVLLGFLLETRGRAGLVRAARTRGGPAPAQVASAGD